MALCNNITSCHAPAEDMSSLDAFWYLARTPEGTTQGQRANSVQLSQDVHIRGSLAKSWPLQHQLLIHNPSYQQYPPLFLWGQSLGHSSPMRRTEIMLGWMSSSWQTEGTFCSYCWFNTFGFVGILFCWHFVLFCCGFFPGPLFLLICCVSDSKRSCSCCLSWGIRVLFTRLSTSSCQTFFAIWVLGNFKMLEYWLEAWSCPQVHLCSLYQNTHRRQGLAVITKKSQMFKISLFHTNGFVGKNKPKQNKNSKPT